MIKYAINEEKRTVIAWLDNTQYDAYNQIGKMLRDTKFCAVSKNYLMPNMFKVKLVCDPRDEFNVEFGKKRARKILLDNYYKSLDKRIAKFREDVLIMNGKVFETPAEIEIAS